MRVNAYTLAQKPAEWEWPESVPSWGILYATEDFGVSAFLGEYRRRYPGVPVVGTSSFRGVFTPSGFVDGAGLLTANTDDRVRLVTATRTVGAAEAGDAARAAAAELRAGLGQCPAAILMHATPGFEELILSGLAAGFERGVPVYGGSAADNALRGRWRVFTESDETDEGFVLAAFASEETQFCGSFLDGYLPTNKQGRVTRALGRRIYEIEGRPAALVYNQWTGGAIASKLRSGGPVLSETNLRPLARSIQVGPRLERRLLSHPSEVHADGSLSLFTNVSEGDTFELMIGTAEPLIRRIDKVVSRALPRTCTAPRGAIFIYCAGCLTALPDRADEVAATFAKATGGAPFIGAATFGEQGSLGTREPINAHGNLMCSAFCFV